MHAPQDRCIFMLPERKYSATRRIPSKTSLFAWMTVKPRFRSAAMKDAETAVIDDEYFVSELRDTESKLEPLFRRARKLHKRGKFARANEVYGEILALDPTNGEAYVGRLLCDLRMRNVPSLHHP